MKAILIIDVDDEYLGKEISVIKFTNGSAIFCETLLTPPLILKPLPKKYIKIAQISNGKVINTEDMQFMAGYNKCLDEILEGE